MHKQRSIILSLSILGLLSSLFLPWVSFGFMTVSGSKGDGWISMVFFIVPLIVSVIGDKSGSLKGGGLIAAAITGILAVLLGLYEINNITKFMSISVISYGLYLLILSGLAIALVSFLLKDKS